MKYSLLLYTIFYLSVFILTSNSYSNELILDQSFESKSEVEKSFFLGEMDDRVTYLNGDRYYFEFTEGTSYKFSTVSIGIGGFDEYDFELETQLTIESSDDYTDVGIILNLNKESKEYYLFTINDQKQFSFIKYQDDNKKTYKFRESSEYLNKASNEIFIKRSSNILEITVNGKLIYSYDNYQPNGNDFGFALTKAGQVISIDHIKAWKRKREIKKVDNPLTDAPKEYLVNVNSQYDEISPRISPDGNTLYFVRNDHPENEGGSGQDIWYSKVDDENRWTEPKKMPFPINNKGPNSLISITPDNNTIFLSNTYKSDGKFDGTGMSVSHKTREGWEIPQEVNIKNFYNHSRYVSYFMSSDQNILFTAIERNDTYGGQDIYISFKNEDETYTEPKNLGDEINTFADDFNPSLAADNKTLYFCTSGRPGYGDVDIWVTKRLDSTWLNWSEPKNLGSGINSPDGEYAFTTTASGDAAYMVTSQKHSDHKGKSDIVRVQLSESAKPEPVVMVYGKVLNKKTNEPVEADIDYFGLNDEKDYGKSSSDPATGEYKIVLPRGVNYGFKSSAEGFIPVSENLDLTDLTEYKEIEKNLYLVPAEVGQTVRLNNIFFDTGESELRNESEKELQNLLDVLESNKNMHIQISGHTDNIGSKKDNLKLSQDRAQAVVNWLTDNGISNERLTAKGYGQTKPLASNESEEGRQLNRRVEFTILEN